MDVPANKMSPQEYVHVERDLSVPAGGDRVSFIVSGELDIGNVDRLIRAVAPVAVQSAHLVLDLSRLGFMDCSGIRAMIEILNAVRPDGRLIIRRPSPPVRRVLELVDAGRLEGLVIIDS